MNSWPRLFVRLVIILVWLFLISLPLFAFLLAARQEINIGGEENYLRVFLLREKDVEGIGLETSRSFPERPSCTETKVRYLMWVGEPENVDFCHCNDPQTGYSLPAASGACNNLP